MQADNGMSVGEYLVVLKRRRHLIAYVFVPIFVVGAVLALALPDFYRSTARFQLVSERITATTAGPTVYIDQQVFALADKVLTIDTLSRLVEEIDPYPGRFDDPADAVGQLRHDVNVAMVSQNVMGDGGRQNTVYTGFNVSYVNPDPEKVGQVATRLAQLFLEGGRADLLQAATQKATFFSSEEKRISRQMSELEVRLADFKSANFNRLPEAAQANLTTRGRLEQEYDGIQREIRTLQQNRVFVAQQLRQAQAGPSAGNLRQLEDEYARKSAVYADTHPDMVAMRRQIEQLRQGGTVATGTSLQAQLEQERASLAEARQRYSDDHPDIRRMLRNIDMLETRVASGENGTNLASGSETLMSVQLQTQLNAIDTQISGLQARADSLRSRFAQLDAQLSAMPEVEREYQDISRGLDSAREQFSQMVGRRLDAEADIAAITDGAADRFTLFAEPVTPWGPSGPPRLGIIIVSLLLGVVLSLAAAIASEVVDTSIRGTRDVRAVFGCSPLGVVPEIRTSVVRARGVRRASLLAGSVLVVASVLYLFVHITLD